VACSVLIGCVGTCGSVVASFAYFHSLPAMISLTMTDPFRTQIYPPQAQEVYDLWLAAHGGKRFPKQADLDLMAIPRLVPSCFILDVVNQTRFRYRFVGTAIEEHIGELLTGRMMDEVRKGKLLQTLTDLFGTTQRNGQAGMATTQMPTETRGHMLYHRLSLPLSDNGETVDKIFGCHFFELPSNSGFNQPYVEPPEGDEINRLKMVFSE